jgi:hypothetical protein
MAKKPQKPPRRILRGERRTSRGEQPSGRRCCGLCGATNNLTKTECCGQWICDDEDQYVMFSYDRNSCHRNHRRFTLCGSHFTEGHEGNWQDCPKCRENCATEMYVYYGTNEYNFSKLSNPPEYEPTLCSQCGKVIHLGEGGYSHTSEGYSCVDCTSAKFPGLFPRIG